MEIKEFISETAKSAGEIIRSHYGCVKDRRIKVDRGDIVTEVDFESESCIINRIRQTFPDHNIISEEAGQIGEDENAYTWFIDPLDGTRNYALGIPLFCVSIALTKNGTAECGVIYDPLHDELFYAARGQGATLNDVPIHVSAEADIEDAIISVSWIRRRANQSQFVEYVDRIARETSYFRRLGSAALISAYVASGRADVYMQGAINAWDIAAGTVLIEEAGGTVTDFEGKPIDLRKPYTDIIAANPTLHAKMLAEIIRQ
jgi:myo-inositol-1(or 4)-monophosphatase